MTSSSPPVAETQPIAWMVKRLTGDGSAWLWTFTRDASAPRWADLASEPDNCIPLYVDDAASKLAGMVVELKLKLIAVEAEAADALIALQSDKARLDWLETMVVNVRSQLAYGSANVFWASPEGVDEFEIGPSDLRKQIDTHMQIASLSRKGE